MIITCEKCSTRFNLDDTLIKPGGTRVRCSKCQHIFTAFPEKTPVLEPPLAPSDHPEPEEQDISFDEPQFQDDSDFNASQDQDDDFDIDSDFDSQEPDLEETDLDFSEIEFTETEFEDTEFKQDPPEHIPDAYDSAISDQGLEMEGPLQDDFHEDGLDFETEDFDSDFDMEEPELEAKDFEFGDVEEDTSSLPASLSSDSDEDTADIEISFAQNQASELELEELSFDVEDTSETDEAPAELPALEIDDDSQADLILEDDDQKSFPEPEEFLDETPAQPQEEITETDELSSNDAELESDDDNAAVPESQATDTDEKIEQTVSEQDKFAEYDKVLEQETEPEDTEITIPDPEVEDNTDPVEPMLPPAKNNENEIEPSTETLTSQKPLIDKPSAKRVRQKRGTRKNKKVSLPVVILLVVILLFLAAYVAITRLGVTVPMVSDIQIPFITEWLQPKQPPQPPLKPIPDEPSINGRFVTNKSAGTLFIITGKIKNPSKAAVSHIQVKGTLMTKENKQAATLTAYCGNIIPEETLKSGNISDITNQMGVKQGNQNTNVNIKPGASVMFMLVFSNLPEEDLANFTVAVDGFEPAKQ